MSDFSFQKIYSYVYLPSYLSFTGNVPSPQQPPVPRPGRRGRDPIPVPEPEDQVSWKGLLQGLQCFLLTGFVIYNREFNSTKRLVFTRYLAGKRNYV